MANTHQMIVDSAEQQIANLETVEADIVARVSEIKEKKRKGKASSDDLKRLADLKAAHTSVLKAVEDLAVVTMKALDQSDELARIISVIAGVVTNLKGTAQRIARIGEIAEKIGNLLGGVSELSKNIAALKKDKA